MEDDSGLSDLSKFLRETVKNDEVLYGVTVKIRQNNEKYFYL